MKMEFKAAVTQREQEERGEDDSIEFTIAALDDDSDHLYTMIRPTTAQLGLFAGSTADTEDGQAAMGGLLDFLHGVLEGDGYRNLKRRLNNRDSGLELDDVMEVIRAVVKVFTGFPTQPSKDSPPSPTSTGPKSTANVPVGASTRSRSTRAASTT